MAFIAFWCDDCWLNLYDNNMRAKPTCTSYDTCCLSGEAWIKASRRSARSSDQPSYHDKDASLAGHQRPCSKGRSQVAERNPVQKSCSTMACSGVAGERRISTSSGVSLTCRHTSDHVAGVPSIHWVRRPAPLNLTCWAPGSITQRHQRKFKIMPYHFVF